MDPTRPLAPRDPPTPDALRPVALRVTVVTGPDAGLAVAPDAPVVRVGRGETADVRLSDPTVSQFHAELSVTSDGGIHVRDLGSRNGTRAGAFALESAVVPAGAVLALGSSAVRVELAPRAAAATHPARAREVAAFGGLVGAAPAMRELYALLERLARTDLSVLIEGETGTGKDLVARGLHAAGRRGSGPFVVLDCSAIPASLAQSVLFGHEKGAFTGATERRAGVFEAADGGTVFLDEVGELPLDLQPMLLRVLQAREVVPVGASRPRAVDVRVVAATWRDLRAMVNRGTFREDLYYRLAQAVVTVPSLAARTGDVPLLVQHFLARLPPGVQAARTLTPEALQAISARHYPGNVRELQSTVERLALLADGPVITAADLAFERMLANARARPSPPGSEASAAAGSPVRASVPPPPPAHPAVVGAAVDGAEPVTPYKEAKRTLVDEFERTYLIRLLARVDNNLSRAAALAEIKRFNLRELLKKHGLYDRRRDD